MRIFAILIALGLAGAWWITAPARDSADRLAGLTPDLTNGEAVFHAGGCASCHADKEATDPRPVLAGGTRLASDFGVFVSPNISSDPVYGIGGWSALDLWNAMHHGTSPDGAHYYPAFPYSSYNKVTPQDVVDLHGFLMTLPASDTASADHELGFPFTIRRSLGAWKLLAVTTEWHSPAEDDSQLRGRYLVEALGHCAECHTPRNAIGILNRAAWMHGAPNPSGEGRIPPLHRTAFDWPAEDIAYYLESGFTPDFDSVGGSMASVVANFAKLSPQDRAAVAGYIVALP